MNNRDIEFRAWDEVNKIMHTNVQFIASGNESNDWICIESDQEHCERGNGLLLNNPYLRPQIKLIQYTGLLDKNGKKIFEGDIVSTHVFTQELGMNMGLVEGEKIFTSIVEYYQNDCAFVLVNIENGDLYNFSQIEDPKEELEIIGNIYSNPELPEASND